MKFGLNEQQAKEDALSCGLILGGFTVASDHSMVLCEQGKEYFHSRKRADQRQSAGSSIRTREHRG